MGADIALFPEMWSNGYDLHSRPAKEWKQDALPCDGDFVRTFGKLAEELPDTGGITMNVTSGRAAEHQLRTRVYITRRRTMYKIVKSEMPADKIYLMDVEAPRIARACQPGEFVIVKMDEAGERIPLNHL